MCCGCRCSVYTVCLAATSICASATATPVVAADTTPPVITVRAPAANSVNATGYVATTVYVGESHIPVHLVHASMLLTAQQLLLLWRELPYQAQDCGTLTTSSPAACSQPGPCTQCYLHNTHEVHIAMHAMHVKKLFTSRHFGSKCQHMSTANKTCFVHNAWQAVDCRDGIIPLVVSCYPEQHVQDIAATH